MVVRPDGAFHGTIGGGQLEFRMLDIAREMLAAGRGPARIVDQALGPDLGQCCGGRVKILIETFDAADLEDHRAARGGRGRRRAVRGRVPHGGGPREARARLRRGRRPLDRLARDPWRGPHARSAVRRRPCGSCPRAGACAPAVFGALARRPGGCLSRPHPAEREGGAHARSGGRDRRGRPRLPHPRHDPRPPARHGDHGGGAAAGLSLCGPHRQRHEAGAVREALPGDRASGRHDPLPRLPHRAPGHRRQGPGGHRRLRDGAAAAGAGARAASLENLSPPAASNDTKPP